MNRSEAVSRLRALIAEVESSSEPWADEPKTLTPAEALRALADGKCVQSSRFIYKLVGKEICNYNAGRTPEWFTASYIYRSECHIVPDPSQPAEPQLEHNGYCDKAGAYPRSHPCVKCQSDYLKREQASVMSSRGLSSAVDEQPAEHAKPPLKVGDRVRRKWPPFSIGRVIAIDFSKGDEAIQVQWDDGVGAYPNDSGLVPVEAEPQVEYPLTYGEAIAAAVGGAVVSAAARPECRYWYSRGFRYRSPSTKTVAVYDGWDADDEEMCCGKWRIVKEGK